MIFVNTCRKNLMNIKILGNKKKNLRDSSTRSVEKYNENN
jgi:hypothetical protein